jgi:hypothetical protein
MEQEAKTPLSLFMVLQDGRQTYRHHHARCVPKTENLDVPTDSKDPITTMMLRNIPNRYTQAKLLQEIDECGFEGSYDFFYLPIDVHSRSNVGYAFVNFVTDTEAARFQSFFSQHRFVLSNRRKISMVSRAHVQGLEQNIRHFEHRAVTQARNSKLRPVVMRKGVQVSFEEAVRQATQEDTTPPTTAPITPRSTPPSTPAWRVTAEPVSVDSPQVAAPDAGLGRLGLELALLNLLGSRSSVSPETPAVTMPAIRPPPGLCSQAGLGCIVEPRCNFGEPCYIELAEAVDNACCGGSESGGTTPRTNGLDLQISLGGLVRVVEDKAWELL